MMIQRTSPEELAKLWEWRSRGADGGEGFFDAGLRIERQQQERVAKTGKRCELEALCRGARKKTRKR